MSHTVQSWTHVWGADEAVDREVCRAAGMCYCEPGNPADAGRKAYHARALVRVQDGRRWCYCPVCGAAWNEPQNPMPAIE